MKRYFSVCLTALSILLLAACGKEPPVSPDTEEYPYSLSVWNEDYTEEVALSKMGLLEALPSRRIRRKKSPLPGSTSNAPWICLPSSRLISSSK